MLPVTVKSARATARVLSSKAFKLAYRQQVKQTRATRAVLKAAYRALRQLQRINKIRERRNAKKARLENRKLLKKLRAGRKIPSLRVRSQGGPIALEALPKGYFYTKQKPGSKHTFPTQTWYAYVQGGSNAITDYSPVVKLNPPRNLMWAQRERWNSLSASASLENQGTYASIVLPKSKFGALGLRAWNMYTDLTQNIELDESRAESLMVKLQSKAYSADIQLNEYLFEWRQVFTLLKDPYRTALRLTRLIERWTRRDSWIWLPSHRVRKYDRGLLVSKTPLGGMLMSMRTKRFIDPYTVSLKVLGEACNRWLQYRYGIMPLVLDITKVMGDWVTPKLIAPLQSVSAREKVNHVELSRDYSTTVAPLVFNFRVKYEKGEFYSGKQWFKLLEEPPMSYRLGVHPKQWINGLWNALPLSFVADWVVNVDDWLKATTDVPWIQLHGNYVTRKIYERITSRLVSIHTTSSVDQKLTVKGDPIAIATREAVHRAIDRPRAVLPSMSEAWHSVKNAITALTLIPGQLGLSLGRSSYYKRR